jgi:hypothetical protein
MLIQVCGSKKILDAYSNDYWTLIRWLRPFEINNALPYMLKNPDVIGKHGVVWKLVSCVPKNVTKLLTWLSPAFIFVVKKPFDSSVYNKD